MNHLRHQPTLTQEQPRPEALPAMQPGLSAWTLPQTPWAWYADPAPLASLAQAFEPISLKQMDAVALLNRTDTKYVMTQGQLLTALAALQEDYFILSIHGQRLNHYRTLYFDTADFQMYTAHVNGRSERYKVRSRAYTDSSLSFLEVKHKTRKGRTIKDRIPTPQQVTAMNLDAEIWLHNFCPLDARCLEPKLWNSFTRLTLVSKDYSERVTLDVDLSFHANGRWAQLEGLAIAELKQDVSSSGSLFARQMRTQHIHARGFSKYCIGVAMLYDTVKKNALKPKLLWVEKLTR